MNLGGKDELSAVLQGFFFQQLHIISTSKTYFSMWHSAEEGWNTYLNNTELTKLFL